MARKAKRTIRALSSVVEPRLKRPHIDLGTAASTPDLTATDHGESLQYLPNEILDVIFDHYISSAPEVDILCVKSKVSVRLPDGRDLLTLNRYWHSVLVRRMLRDYTTVGLDEKGLKLFMKGAKSKDGEAYGEYLEVTALKPSSTALTRAEKRLDKLFRTYAHIERIASRISSLHFTMLVRKTPSPDLKYLTTCLAPLEDFIIDVTNLRWATREIAILDMTGVDEVHQKARGPHEFVTFTPLDEIVLWDAIRGPWMPSISLALQESITKHRSYPVKATTFKFKVSIRSHTPRDLHTRTFALRSEHDVCGCEMCRTIGPKDLWTMTNDGNMKNRLT